MLKTQSKKVSTRIKDLDELMKFINNSGKIHQKNSIFYNRESITISK